MINEILSSLCALPHRCSTSMNERRAASYLAEKLAELEVEPEREAFVAPTTYSWLYLIFYAGFIIGAAAGAYYPVTGLLLVLAAAVLFYGEQTTRFRPLARWVPQGLSHNVTGTVPARIKPRLTLVLCAHYDTSKASLAFHPRLVAGLRRAYVVSLVMIALVIAGSAGRALAPASAARVISWLMAVPMAYLGVMALSMIEREVRGRPVNGAADNASGVAVVMELAKRVKQQDGLDHCKTVILLTGAEEVGMAGMAWFMEEQGDRLDPQTTLFLNFDNTGSGRLSYIIREGMLRRLAADPELVRAAQETAAAEPRFRDITGRSFDALTLDTLVPHARGFRTLTIMALSELGIPQPWHWPDDVLDNVDRDLVALAADFGWEIVRRMDRG